MIRRCGPLLIIVVVLSGSALGDHISLKNGDRLTGSIVKFDGKTIVFKSDMAGEVSVTVSNVTGVTSDNPIYVTLSDGRTVSGVMSTRGSRAEIKSSAGVVEVERSAIKYIRSEAEQKLYEKTLDPGWLEQWSGSANVGFSLTKGDSDTANLAVGMAISRETRRDKTSLNVTSIYNRERNDGVAETVANTIRFGARYDRNINRKWFGYGFTDLEHDELEELRLRWVLGGGLGFHTIKNDRTKLDLLGGLDMNKEYFNGPDNNRTSLEAQLGQTLDHKFSKRLSLKETLYFFPNLSNAGEYRINFDTSVVMDLNRRLAWQITLSDRYLSNPPEGSRQNDLLLTTGLKVKLGTIK